MVHQIDGVAEIVVARDGIKLRRDGEIAVLGPGVPRHIGKADLVGHRIDAGHDRSVGGGGNQGQTG
jgi:hypothetical protein